MRTCPYCNSDFSDDQSICPSCGAQYWESDNAAQDADHDSEEEAQGCLSIFAFHFLVALAGFVLLLFVGFVINLIVHFEENQIKVIWIGAALLLASALSGLIARFRKKKAPGKKG